MIFYFSGAGNSLYVARRIAAATGDRLVAVERCLAGGDCRFDCRGERRVGFVFPVHFWGLPAIVADFLRKLKLDNLAGYVFSVATCGTSTGQANWMMARALQRIGVKLDGRYSVRMVDTWTPMFDLTDAEKNHQRELSAEAEIDAVAESVAACRQGRYDRGRVPHLVAGIYHSTYDRQRLTAHFSVDSRRCTGCGLCAHHCPSSAIEIADGKAKWVKTSCTLCLRCLHHCPNFAIQRGRRTARHGQYVNPHEKSL